VTPQDLRISVRGIVSGADIATLHVASEACLQENVDTSTDAVSIKIWIMAVLAIFFPHERPSLLIFRRGVAAE
jgi:hypothetical protein